MFYILTPDYPGKAVGKFQSEAEALSFASVRNFSLARVRSAKYVAMSRLSVINLTDEINLSDFTVKTYTSQATEKKLVAKKDVISFEAEKQIEVVCLIKAETETVNNPENTELSTVNADCSPISEANKMLTFEVVFVDNVFTIEASNPAEALEKFKNLYCDTYCDLAEHLIGVHLYVDSLYRTHPLAYQYMLNVECISTSHLHWKQQKQIFDIQETMYKLVINLDAKGLHNFTIGKYEKSSNNDVKEIISEYWNNYMSILSCLGIDVEKHQLIDIDIDTLVK